MTKIDYPDMTLPDGDKRHRSLEINEKGELIYFTTDIGPGTAKLAPNGGDSDYEYSATISGEAVNRVVLELILERFETVGDFRKWLEVKGIKSEFWSY